MQVFWTTPLRLKPTRWVNAPEVTYILKPNEPYYIGNVEINTNNPVLDSIIRKHQKDSKVLMGARFSIDKLDLRKEGDCPTFFAMVFMPLVQIIFAIRLTASAMFLQSTWSCKLPIRSMARDMRFGRLIQLKSIQTIEYNNAVIPQ